MTTQPATLDVEADIPDIGLYVAEQLPDRPAFMFGPAGEECVFQDLAPYAGEAIAALDVFALSRPGGGLSPSLPSRRYGNSAAAKLDTITPAPSVSGGRSIDCK